MIHDNTDPLAADDNTDPSFPDLSTGNVDELLTGEAIGPVERSRLAVLRQLSTGVSAAAFGSV